MRQQLTVDDLACLILLCKPELNCSWRSDAGAMEEWLDVEPDEAFDPHTANVEMAVNQFRVEEKYKYERYRLVQHEYPELKMLLMSGWCEFILTHQEDISTLYGDDTPFKSFNGYLQNAFHFNSFDDPWQMELPRESWDILKDLASTLLADWQGKQLGGFRIIAQVYLGLSPHDVLEEIELESLMPLLIDGTTVEWSGDIECGWNQVREPGYGDINPICASPVMNVLCDWASSCFWEYSGVLFDEDDKVTAKAVLIVCDGVSELLHRLANNSVSRTNNFEVYIRARKSSQIVFIPNFNDILNAYSCEYTTVHGTQISRVVARFIHGLLKLHYSGRAPYSMIRLTSVDFGEQAFLALNKIDTAYAGLWKRYVLIANVFDEFVGEWIATDASWIELLDLVQDYIAHKMFAQADDLISMWLYVRVLILKKNPHYPGRLAEYIGSISSGSCPNTDRTLHQIVRIGSADKSVADASHALLVLLRPDVQAKYPEQVIALPWLENRSDEEIRQHLEEIFTTRLWDAMPARMQGDLVKAEHYWNQLRLHARKNGADAKNNEPERAVFIHWSCALESELKLSLEPVLATLKEYFSKSPVGSSHSHYRLQYIANGRASLGDLINLIIRRKKKDKLGEFPDLLASLNRSDLIQRIISVPEKRSAFEQIASTYRNNAAHDSPEILGLTQAAATRDILFKRGLFAEIVRCRLDQPIMIEQ